MLGGGKREYIKKTGERIVKIKKRERERELRMD